MIKNRRTLLFLILSISFVLLICFSIGLKLKLFWSTPWIDSPSHFIGGLLSSLIVVFLISYSVKLLSTSRRKKIYLVLLGSLIIGVFWEIFELALSMTNVHDSGYYLDTISDLFFDCLGAFVGITYFFRRIIWINN